MNINTQFQCKQLVQTSFCRGRRRGLAVARGSVIRETFDPRPGWASPPWQLVIMRPTEHCTVLLYCIVALQCRSLLWMEYRRCMHHKAKRLKTLSYIMHYYYRVLLFLTNGLPLQPILMGRLWKKNFELPSRKLSFKLVFLKDSDF